MTPAIQLAKRQRIDHRIHEYHHDPGHTSFGLEAAEKLNIDPARVFKTLVVRLDNNQLAVAVLPVARQLSMKLMARASGAKKAAMAEATEVQRTTGYVLGGVSPLGQKKRLPTVIDASARAFATMFVSAGRRGLEIELKPEDLRQLTRADFADIGQ